MSSNLTAGITPLAQSVERGSNKPKVNRSKLLWSIFLSPVGGARFAGNPVQIRTGKGSTEYRDLAQRKRVWLITKRSQDRNLESRIGSTVLRRYRLMVRTLVFETSNPGSIPGSAKLLDIKIEYFFYYLIINKKKQTWEY